MGPVHTSACIFSHSLELKDVVLDSIWQDRWNIVPSVFCTSDLISRNRFVAWPIVYVCIWAITVDIIKDTSLFTLTLILTAHRTSLGWFLSRSICFNLRIPVYIAIWATAVDVIKDRSLLTAITSLGDCSIFGDRLLSSVACSGKQVIALTWSFANFLRCFQCQKLPTHESIEWVLTVLLY